MGRDPCDPLPGSGPRGSCRGTAAAWVGVAASGSSAGWEKRLSAGTGAAGGFEARCVRLGPRSPCLLGRPARRPGGLISVASRYPIWGMETNGSLAGRVEGRGSGPPLVSPCSRRPSQNAGRHSPLLRDTPLPTQSKSIEQLSGISTSPLVHSLPTAASSGPHCPWTTSAPS